MLLELIGESQNHGRDLLVKFSKHHKVRVHCVNHLEREKEIEFHIEHLGVGNTKRTF